MSKKIFFKLFILLVLCVLTHCSSTFSWGNILKDNVGIFFFPNETNNLFINNEKLLPAFNRKNTVFEPLTLFTLQTNSISNGKISIPFKLKEIKENNYFLVFVGSKKYRINLFDPTTIPTYQVKNNNENASKGYYFITPVQSTTCKKAAAYIINEKGQLLYYRRSTINQRCLSDFKKIKLPNGKTRYTVMQQTQKMPPFGYWGGSLLVLNENFKPIKSLQLLKHKGHPALPVENHHSIYLDDNHYILSSYWHTEILDQDDNPVKIAVPIIQEIKDNKVVFEFNGTNYPEFINSCMIYFNPTVPVYKDFWHYNNLEIDPHDNNWIISFANQNAIVKIDKSTGKILWTLGGINDEFKLQQKHFFVFQHAPVFTKDNYLMLYDNSTYRDRIFRNKTGTRNSRILKFKIDEKDKKIVDFKEFKLPFFSISMGSAYEAPDNTIIVSGGSNSKNAVSEIDFSMNKIVPIFSLTDTQSYRVYKYKSWR